jgi:hypothetical protein
MKLAELHCKLIATARAHPPGDDVPYAFEQRVMARLPLRPVLDAGTQWARALWRAAASCVALAVVLGVWALVAPKAGPANGDLSRDFVVTVLAPVTQDSN